MVHGRQPHIYMAWEDIASDPNLTCEVLYRTLLFEEFLRGFLPPKLYLQLDNCIRENKNTVFIGYLCWLVERGIFKSIELSFLPVGHTHFDCDQVASCIGFATLHTNITSVDKMVDVLSTCYSPAPQVSFIGRVADVGGLMNPGDKKDFPVGSSRILSLRGCATKRLIAGREPYMKPSSALHWLIRRDTAGAVFIQTKLTCDDEEWSAMTYPFATDAPRPDSRPTAGNMSGLKPGDLHFRAPKPFAEGRRKALKSSLDKIKSRVTNDDMAAIWEVYERLQRGEPSEAADDGWAFANEGYYNEKQDEEDAQEGPVYIRRAPAIYLNQSMQEIARRHRRSRGRAENELVRGHFLAIVPNFLESVPDEERCDFWVGRIIDMHAEDRKVKVTWYNTPVIKNGNIDTNQTAKYRNYTGKGDRTGWIRVSKILTQFEKLTEKCNRIRKQTIRTILNALELNRVERAQPGYESEPASSEEDDDE